MKAATDATFQIAGPGTDDAIEAAALLRQAAEYRLDLDWELAGELDDSTLESLRHLPPPNPRASEQVRRWRDSYREGLLFYRRGPSFVSITDRRFVVREILTATGPLVDCLHTLNTPSEHRCIECDLLEAEGLALTDGVRRIFLPPRLRYPPIPFTAL